MRPRTGSRLRGVTGGNGVERVQERTGGHVLRRLGGDRR
jgi:hypothetical protein